MQTNTIDISTAAELLGVTGERIRQMCVDGKLAGAAKCGNRWRIPQTAHVKLIEKSATEAAIESTDLSLVPKSKRDEAIRRAGIIAACERYCGAAVSRGFFRSEAMKDFSQLHGIPLRTLQRWISAYKNTGISGLIDTRGGTGKGPTITPDAWVKFQEFYLTEKRNTVQQCRQDVIGFAARNELGWKVPSVRRMQQMAKHDIPYPLLVLGREGKDAYEAKCAPYIIKDFDSIEPGAVWVGDHHQFNCWIWYRDNWYRPWMTAWEDMRSRKIVGWHINVCPNQVTVLQAFAAGARMFGVPESVKIDNGKDYDSEMWTGVTKLTRKRAIKKGYIDEPHVAGLYGMMNITVSFAIPYNAKAKPVERFFKTMNLQFTNTIPTYCGESVAKRPEDVYKYMKTDKAKAEAFSLEEFAGLVEQYIEIYNATPHKGEGMDGRTPDEVFNLRPAKRMIDAGSLDLLCTVWTGKQKVKKNGVKVKGLWYGHCDPVLMMHQGKEVYCSYDPEDMTQVRIYDANHNYIITAEQASATGYGQQIHDEDIREANRRVRRAKNIIKNSVPAARVARTSMVHLTLEAAQERTRAAEPEGPKPIRPVATPMDGQAKTVKRVERQRKVRRAAGAENTTHVPDLHWDDEPVAVEDNGPSLTLDFEPQQRQGNFKLTLMNDE